MEAAGVVLAILFVVALVYVRERWGDGRDGRAENRHLGDAEKLHEVERATGTGRYGS